MAGHAFDWASVGASKEAWNQARTAGEKPAIVTARPRYSLPPTRRSGRRDDAGRPKRPVLDDSPYRDLLQDSGSWMTRGESIPMERSSHRIGGRTAVAPEGIAS